MSELELSWDLTPTERRIAETAFAISHIDYDPLARAYDAVIAVRSLRNDVRDRQVSLMEREKMLAELRREPEAHGSEWRTALEWALGLEPDAENHTPEWAANLVREIREIGNRR
jgi:hypothetical protein